MLKSILTFPKEHYEMDSYYKWKYKILQQFSGPISHLHFLRNIYNSGNIKLNSVRIDFPPNVFMHEDSEV